MKEKTVFILPNGNQITLCGAVEPIDMVGYECLKEISEIVDDVLVHCYTFKPTNSRELAARILGQLELYGSFYYQIEDWLTDFLDGKEHDLPIGIEGEYLRCALRVELRDFFYNRDDIDDIESEDIEECVNRIIYHVSENTLNMNFISDIVDEYVEEKKEERLEYLLNKEKVCPLDKEERYELNKLQGGF